MIALLSGELAYRSVDHVVIDAGGVGYRLFVPLSTFYALPEQGRVRLHVYTHVKEDALHLYGFLTPAEKELFVLLIGVSGVGPRLAINILSNIPAEELQGALSRGDAKRLAAVPGIGRKTSERLILELRDKVAPPTSTGQPGKVVTVANSNPLEEALSALVNLGYKEPLARKALEALDVAPEAPLETILRGALKLLAR